MEWIEAPEGSIAAASNGKLRSLKNNMQKRRLQIVSQADPAAYTHWSRKNNGTGGQIDAWWCNLLSRCSQAVVAKDSRLIIGTDHEQVSVTFTIAFPKSQARISGGSREVIHDNFAIPSPLTQQGLEQLAEKITQPRVSSKVVIPDHVLRLRRLAKQSRSPQQWKEYMAALRDFRQHRRERAIEQASTDWGEYRKIKRAGASAWQAEYGLDSAGEPLEGIREHFSSRFDRCPTLDRELDLLILRFLSERPDTRAVDFTEAEVHAAFMKGGNRKSVGVDRVPQELLKSMVQRDDGLTELTQFFNKVFRERSTPESWNVSLMSLLAKVAKPSEPKDLRPIMMSSHASKTYSRLVLGRLRQHFLPSGPEQCASAGRQTADVLYSLHTVSQLSLEWGVPLAIIRLDIAKAFDTVDRAVLATTLLKEVGPHFPMETVAVVDMLRSGVTKVDTQWGSCTFRNGVGVKQGSVESLCVFAWLIDLLLAYAKQQQQLDHAWPEGCAIDKVAFMDDVIGWAGSTKVLQARMVTMMKVLAQWGLHLNVDKCALLCFGEGKSQWKESLFRPCLLTNHSL